MISLIIGIMVSLVVTIVGTPLLIKWCTNSTTDSTSVRMARSRISSSAARRRLAAWSSTSRWCSAGAPRHCIGSSPRGEVPSWSAVLVLFAMLSMGFLGFIDDFAKVRKKQSEGLTVKGKFIGQFILATIYAVLALILPTKSGFPSAQAGMSFIEEPFFSFEFAGKVVAIVLFVNLGELPDDRVDQCHQSD
mgnify:CR=1 FL=1